MSIFEIEITDNWLRGGVNPFGRADQIQINPFFHDFP